MQPKDPHSEHSQGPANLPAVQLLLQPDCPPLTLPPSTPQSPTSYRLWGTSGPNRAVVQCYGGRNKRNWTGLAQPSTTSCHLTDLKWATCTAFRTNCRARFLRQSNLHGDSAVMLGASAVHSNPTGRSTTTLVAYLFPYNTGATKLNGSQRRVLSWNP